MVLPFFYIEQIDPGSSSIDLNEETAKHVVQVLRMGLGEQLQLTDGKGKLVTVEIAEVNRKKCGVRVLQTANQPPQLKNITLAISLIKNSSRFEWFLEKATEIGIVEIIPLICERTEKHYFRHVRMNAILVSAMLQSRQCWLPLLHEPMGFEKLWQTADSGRLPALENYQQKFIAHCLPEEKRNLADLINENLHSKMILIGPEGDFTLGEIDRATRHHFIPVSLGNTRLRTETAGIVAASLLMQL